MTRRVSRHDCSPPRRPLRRRLTLSAIAVGSRCRLCCQVPLPAHAFGHRCRLDIAVGYRCRLRCRLPLPPLLSVLRKHPLLVPAAASAACSCCLLLLRAPAACSFSLLLLTSLLSAPLSVHHAAPVSLGDVCPTEHRSGSLTPLAPLHL